MKDNTDKLLNYLVDTAYKNKLEKADNIISINIPVYLKKKLAKTLALSNERNLDYISCLATGEFNFEFKYNIEPELVFTEILDYI